MAHNQNRRKSISGIPSRFSGQAFEPERHSVSNDMFQHLIQNPITSAESSSAGQSSTATPNTTTPLGFSTYAPPITSPFHISQDDPRSSYQHNAWYQQSLQNPQLYQPQPNHFQYQQQQQPNFVFSSPPEGNSRQDSPPEEVDEVVPQQARRKQKGKKRCTEEDAIPKPQKKWSNADARILAERWVHTSQNHTQGNSQQGSRFWKTLQADFNKLASEERNLNQLSGKWNKIQADVKIFNPIFRFLNANRPSGSRDEDVLSAAREQFTQRTRRTFIYEQCWEALKVYPKFYNEEGVMAKKSTIQRKESVNVEDDEVIPSTYPSEDPTLERNMQMLFRDDPIRRPVGRDTSKKTARHSVSSDAATSSRSSRDEAFEAVREAALAQKEAALAQKMHLRKWRHT